MTNAIRSKLFTTTYTETKFVEEFKTTTVFSVFVPIVQDGNDITDAFLTFNTDLAILLLPEGMAPYFSQNDLKVIVQYMVAHLLAYAGITSNSAGNQVTNLKRLANSKSADGLSISYSDIAKLKGEAFSTFVEFLNTTYYGQIVAIFLAKIQGSVGVYAT